MKILANDGMAQSGIDQLEQAGFTVVTEKVAQEDLANAINENDYVAVLVRSATTVRKEVIDACPGLQLIGRGGVGMDNIDVAYAREKGLTVINTPAASSQSVAEMVFAHMFGLARSLHDGNRKMPANGASEFKTLKKKYGKGIELNGKTLGVIGFGRIGQFTARYGLGAGMKVIAHDPFVSEATIEFEIHGHGNVSVKITTTTMDEILANSDFISLHVPKQADGSAVIGKAEFTKMKDGVMLVNAARGGVIDEDALINALDSGKVAACALDVYENEPTPDPRLLSHPKISHSPHVGAATVEAQDRIGLELASQIIEKFGVPA